MSQQKHNRFNEQQAEHPILKELLLNIDKFLAGTINSDELYTFMYVASKSKLNSQISNKKGIEFQV